MPLTPRRTIAFFALFAYATSLGLVMSPHCDAESASGSGAVTIAAHADAAHCKHTDASHAETCTLCSYFAGLAIYFSPSIHSDAPEEIFASCTSSVVSSYSLLLVGSSSHRGPPTSKTIA